MRLFLGFIILLTLGCSTKKRLGPLPERSKQEVLSALLQRNIPFDWFYGKLSTSIKSPDESVSGSMQVRMKKDSILWLVVKKFGFEAARILADKKQYTIIYRFTNEYEDGPISEINDIMSLSANFEDLQELLFGNVILPDETQTSFKKDSIYYVISTTVDDLTLHYYVNGYTLQLDKMIIIDRMNRQATANYSDYKLIPGFGSLPYYRHIEFPYNNVENATIEMKFSEIEINVPKEILFSIPSHYEKAN